MNEEIKNFILKNKDLINQNTKESWEKIYLNLKNNDAFIGEFTYTLLEAGIDPSEVMGYIPSGFLQDSKIKSYEVPKSVNSIAEYAFHGCVSLNEIQFKGIKEDAIKCGIGDESLTKWRSNSSISRIICSDGVIEL